MDWVSIKNWSSILRSEPSCMCNSKSHSRFGRYDQMMTDIPAEDGRSWMVAARCRTTDRAAADMFFGPSGRESTAARLRREATAKAVCGPCPVRTRCLRQCVAYGEEFGIWGGHSAREAAAGGAAYG